MGYDYYIACRTCQSFVDLGRWRIFHDIQFPYYNLEAFIGAGNVAAVPGNGELLHDRLQKLDDPFALHYKGCPDFEKLVTILIKFHDDHKDHELYFINNSGDFPWNVCDGYPWYEWSEIIGPNTDIENIDLPKNLINDLHFKSWDEVEKHLLRSHRYDPAAFPGDIECVKHAYEEVCKK